MAISAWRQHIQNNFFEYWNNDKFKLLWIVSKFFFSSFQIERRYTSFHLSSVSMLCAPSPGVVTTPLVPDYSRHVNVWGHPAPRTRAPLLAPAYCPNFPQLPRGARARDGAAIFCLVKRKIWEICIEQLRSPHSTRLAVLTAKKYFQPCMKLARYNCSNILKLF